MADTTTIAVSPLWHRKIDDQVLRSGLCRGSHRQRRQAGRSNQSDPDAAHARNAHKYEAECDEQDHEDCNMVQNIDPRPASAGTQIVGDG